MKALVAKLTDDQVRQMRAEHWPYARGKGYASLARKFRCSNSTARDICTYRTRKKVRPLPNPLPQAGEGANVKGVKP